MLTAHPGVDYRMVVPAAPLVFDARGVTVGIDATSVIRLSPKSARTAVLL